MFRQLQMPDCQSVKFLLLEGPPGLHSEELLNVRILDGLHPCLQDRLGELVRRGRSQDNLTIDYYVAESRLNVVFVTVIASVYAKVFLFTC